MRGWRAVRMIIAFEMRREWTGVLVTFLFACYFGIIFSGSAIDPLDRSGAARFYDGVRDWVYLFGFPLFGSMMNRTIFGYWRDDPFTRRIAHWRTMPIPLSAIVGARYAQAVLMTAVVGSGFIALQYAIHWGFRERVELSEWVAAGFVWVAYGFVIQSAYILLELGFAGKTFVKWYLGYSIVLALLCVLLAWQDVSVFDEVLAASTARPLVWPAVALVAAVAALWTGSRLTLRQMQRRRYTF